MWHMQMVFGKCYKIGNGISLSELTPFLLNLLISHLNQSALLTYFFPGWAIVEHRSGLSKLSEISRGRKCGR